MKKGSKILSIILVLCMAIQVLPVFASDIEAETVSGIRYLINDDFGAPTDADGGLDGWSLGSYNETFTAGVTATTELEEDSNSNYVLKYYGPDDDTDVSSVNSYLMKEFDTPVTFEDGKNVVFETRFKHDGGDYEADKSEGNKGRSYFKFNVPATYQSADTYQNYNTLFYIRGGVLKTPDGFDESNVMIDNNVASNVTGKWITAKVTINGNTQTASYELVSDDGSINEVIENKDINYAEVTTFAKSPLNNIYFKMRKGNTLYIDYVRAYEEIPVEMTVSPKFAIGESITVGLDKVNAAFKDAVVLYDEAGNEIETVNTIDQTNTTVTLIPVNVLNEGIYTVKLNTATLDANYIAESKSVTVSNFDYLINDSFGAPTDSDRGLDGWTLGTYNATFTAGVTATTELEEGSDSNYVLKYYGPDDDTDVSSVNSYLVRELDTPVTFEDGKNVVFETRFKHDGGDYETDKSESNKGRSYFKFNVPATYQSSDTYQNYNTLFYIRGGVLKTPDGFDESNVMIDNNVASNVTGKWITAKVTINGNTQTASYELVSDDGSINEVIENKDINYVDVAAFAKNPLKNIYFKMRKGNTIYVDYVRVREEIPVVMTVQEKYAVGEPITVSFDKANASFVDVVVLYDEAGNKIETVNTIDETNTVVTLIPVDEIGEGNYIVKFDTGLIEGNYVAENKTITVSNFDYLINDSFGAPTDSDRGLDGWTLGTYNATFTAGVTATTELEEGSDSNYVLKYYGPDDDTDVSSVNSYLVRELDTPVTFEDGKNVVFETRFKHDGGDYETDKSESNKGRSYFKFNVPATYQSSDTYQNYNTLFYIRGGVLKTPDGFDEGNVMIDNNVASNVTGKWITAKVTINGNTQTASYELVSDDGSINEVIENKDINYAEVTTFAKSPLNNIYFKMRKGNTLYVDYVKAYEVNTLAMGVESRYESGKPITITFNKANAAFKDAVKLFDANGNIVEAVNSIDETNTIVTITPVATLSEGYYTAKFDVSVMDGNYTVEDKRITIANRDYILYDHFNVKGQTDGWNHMAVSNEIYAGEVSQTTAEDDNGNTIGVLKLTNDIDGKVVDAAQAGQQAGVIKSFDKITLTEGTKLVIKTKVKYTEENGRFYLKLNRPDSLTLPSNEWGGALYSLFTMNKNGAHYVDGTVMVGSTDIANSMNMNTGLLAGKWVTAEIAVYKENGVDKYDIKINYDDAEKTAKGNFTQAARVYELHGIEGNAFETFETLAFTTYYGVNTVYVDYVEAYLESYEVQEESIIPYITVNGETVTEFKPGKTVVPKFELMPKYNAQTTYTVISALYIDGTLEDVHMNDITTTGETYADTGFTIPETATNATIKAFVWSGDGNMTPLSKPAEAKLKLNAIYLSADGNDNATGTEEEPVATLAKAIELANASALSENLKTANVIVSDGTYYVDSTITINSNIKTVENLSISAAQDANPVFMNAKKLEGTISKVTDPAILSRLNHVDNAETVKNNLYEYDLATAIGGLNKIPSVDLPGSYSYQGNGKTYANGTYTIPYTEDPTCELTFNGSLMTVARYPNTGYLTLTNADIVNAGSAPQEWSEISDNAEKLATPFEIINTRATNWANADQALMYGYWYYDWATETIPVDFVSGTNIVSEFPAYYGLGDDNARRYYVYNLLEEIDQPYEYFIDREYGKIYFYLPDGLKDTDEIAITLNNSYTIEINSPNVTIDGIDFNSSRSGAIKSSSRNVTIKNCDVSNTADAAIYILGGRFNIVENCNIHDVNNAVIVNAGDGKSLYTGGNIIRNNRISKFARLDKTYTYAVSLYGMGHTVEHNKIYDSEHTAIYFQGIENEIKNNDISNVCKETEDAGAIYSGRKWTSRDNKITGNYIHDISSNIEGYSPVGGIFLDDHFADAHIKGNIFANIDGTAVRGNAGREHNIVNNIFVNCNEYATWITSVENPTTDRYATQIADAKKFIYTAGEDSSRAKFQEKYFNELYKYDTDGTTVIVNTDELIYGKGLVFENNLTVNCKSDPGYLFGKNCSVTTTGNKYDTNPSVYFADAAGEDFTVNFSAVKAVIPQFENIDFSAMKID